MNHDPNLHSFHASPGTSETPLRSAGATNRNLPSGFTLVELLVVIAILGILAALLLPSLSRAKVMAKSIRCVNNERQIILGTLQYAQEHEDRLPTCLLGDEEGASGYWNQILPYIGGKSAWLHPILVCPYWENLGTKYYSVPGAFDANHGNYGLISYSAFYFYVTPDGASHILMSWGLPQAKLSSVTASPSIIMAYMCAGSDVSPPGYSIQTRQDQYPTSVNNWNSQAGFVMGYNHNHQANIAFLDGHVETLTRDKAAHINVP